MRTFPLIPSISTGGTRPDSSPTPPRPLDGCSAWLLSSRDEVLLSQQVDIRTEGSFVRPANIFTSFYLLDIPTAKYSGDAAARRSARLCRVSGSRALAAGRRCLHRRRCILRIPLPPFLSCLGSVSQPAPPTWPPSPPPGLLASGLSID